MLSCGLGWDVRVLIPKGYFPPVGPPPGPVLPAPALPDPTTSQDEPQLRERGSLREIKENTPTPSSSQGKGSIFTETMLRVEFFLAPPHNGHVRGCPGMGPSTRLPAFA